MTCTATGRWPIFMRKKQRPRWLCSGINIPMISPICKKRSPPSNDTNLTILAATPILKNLSGILQSPADQRKQGTKITFTCTEPVDLLIGFFNQKGSAFLPPLQLETDASANDYGQAEPRITN